MLSEDTSAKLYADLLNNFALLELRVGRHEAALSRYSQALAIVERLHSETEQARSYHGIARAYDLMGRRGEARVYYKRSLEKRSKSADFAGYVTSVVTYAELLRDDGALDAAIRIR